MKRTHKAYLLTAATCTGILRIPHACSFIVRHGRGVVSSSFPVGAQQHQQQRQQCLLSAQSLDADDWRNHPDLNVRLDFDTWLVPSRHVQTVLKETRVELPLSLRKKIRWVRPFNDTHQLVLRQRHDCHKNNNNNQHHHHHALRQELQLQEGPVLSMQLDPSYFTTQSILQTVLPASSSSSLPPPTSYEQVGHVLHLNLRKQHWPFRHMIGSIFLETLPGVETVVVDSKVVGNVLVDGGPRHPSTHHDHHDHPLEVVAGRNDTEVTVVEGGVSFCFDLQRVHWARYSNMWAGERQYLLRQFGHGQTVVDVFSGVGVLAVLAAKKRHCRVHANDWNPHAIDCLNDAALRNKVHIPTTCGDAYEYLVDLGLHWDTLPHFVVMNHPSDAPTFLSALRWWRIPKKNKNKKNDVVVIPTIYVYTFCHGSSIDTAIDLVAHNLLPEGSSGPTPNRRHHLDDLNCNVQAREVRQVVPGKVIVCVSFKATPQLLRHMQGDYI